jgi:hypothetical protein
MGDVMRHKRGVFMISMHPPDQHYEVRGYVAGFFGIDEREPGKFAVTHLRTGNNLSRLAAPTLDAALEAVAILNARPDIWDNGKFGVKYSGTSRLKWLREMRAFAKTPEGRRVVNLLSEELS